MMIQFIKGAAVIAVGVWSVVPEKHKERITDAVFETFYDLFRKEEEPEQMSFDFDSDGEEHF
jgi:hypothetical protein